MSNAPIIYVADADVGLRDASSQALSGMFDVRLFADGISCVSSLTEVQPSLLLLSTNMPDAPGLDLLRDIRGSSTNLADTHVIAILETGATGKQVRQATEMGANEVLIKPVDFSDLLLRLIATHKLTVERSSLRNQANFAQQVAMTAMSSMGELGIVLQFLSKCFSCKDIEEVAQEVVNAQRQYDLPGAVQIRIPQRALVVGTHGGDIEVFGAILEKLHGLGRIFEFKNRMVINYENVSILMSNLPEDPEKRGRIRDNVAMLAEGAQARMVSIMLEQANRRKQEGIRYALGEILDMTTDLRNSQRENQEKGQAAVTAVIDGFEHSFVSLGLTPSQEAGLIDQLESLRFEVGNIGLTATEIDGKLQSVVRSLQSLAEDDF